MNASHEHEFEAAPGLPEPLPRGEQLLWQGRPDWRSLAIHAFHVRKIAIYFGLMLAVQAAYLVGRPGPFAVAPLVTSAVLAGLALALLAATAWLSARTALYTVTDRRVVMRIGIVLTLTFNLPLRCLAGASLRPLSGGRGDIALQLAGRERIGYANLWPHARAWRLARPEPSLRCVPDAAAVGALIQRHWTALQAAPVAAVAPATPVRPAGSNVVPLRPTPAAPMAVDTREDRLPAATA